MPESRAGINPAPTKDEGEIGDGLDMGHGVEIITFFLKSHTTRIAELLTQRA
jgi:hypothetical protein